jgi:hypothetical protein
MLPGLTPRTCTVPLLQFPLHPINHPFHSIQQWRHSSLAPHARSLSPASAPAPTLHDSNQIVRTKKKQRGEDHSEVVVIPLVHCGAVSADEAFGRACRTKLSLAAFLHGLQREGFIIPRTHTGGAASCPTFVSSPPFPANFLPFLQKHRKEKEKKRGGKERCTVNKNPPRKFTQRSSALWFFTSLYYFIHSFLYVTE